MTDTPTTNTATAVEGSPTGGPGQRTGRRRTRRRGETLMVPPAEFTSYYNRPVVKASPWGTDIPAYLFLGGLAGGSSLLAAGAEVTGRAGLRRSSRLTAMVAIGGSFGALVHDLGRPSRFHHMLRVAKLTSPMSVGTWILSVYGPAATAAALSELPLPCRVRRRWPGRVVHRAGGIGAWVAAATGAAVASYTAVLLADTATPSWHAARRELPFVFVGSAAAAAGGMGMIGAPLGETAPARLLAFGGATLEMAASRRMESSMGLSAEPLHTGRAGRYEQASKVLTSAGAVLAVSLARRSRAASVLGGAALLAGSAAKRFAVFHAGQQSADDPRYTVIPQRQRLQATHQAAPSR